MRGRRMPASVRFRARFAAPNPAAEEQQILKRHHFTYLPRLPARSGARPRSRSRDQEYSSRMDTFKWCSHQELNLDQRFRKPLLYPFELWEPTAPTLPSGPTVSTIPHPLPTMQSSSHLHGQAGTSGRCASAPRVASPKGFDSPEPMVAEHTLPWVSPLLSHQR